MLKIQTQKGKTYYWNYYRFTKHIILLITIILFFIVSTAEFNELVEMGFIE